MQPFLDHHCPGCSYNTSVPFSPSAFSQNRVCSHCGTQSEGINILPQGVVSRKEICAAEQQNELAELFDQSLSLESPCQQTPTMRPVTYTSQHYTHTTHLNARRTDDRYSSGNIENILLYHGINPASLNCAQIELFRDALDDQRQRLLQLWKIAPSQSYEDANTATCHASTSPFFNPSLQSVNLQVGDNNMVFDEDEVSRNSEVHESSLGEDAIMDQAAPSNSIFNSNGRFHNYSEPSLSTYIAAEPYMLSGYEELELRKYYDAVQAHSVIQRLQHYSRATDPVYDKNSNNSIQWVKQEEKRHVPGVMNQTDVIENRCGIFSQAMEGVNG